MQNIWPWLLCSERRSSSYFIHRKNTDSLDCTRLPLDSNASRTCNHNALRNLISQWHVLHNFFSAQREPLRNLLVSGNGILRELIKTFGWKGTAITTLTMYVYRCCWYTSHSSHHVCIKVLYFYLQLALVKVLQPVERHDFVEAFQERLGLFLDAAVEPPLGDEPAVTKQSKAIQQQQNHLETNKDWLFVHWVTSLQLQTKAIQHEKITSWKRILPFAN